jgi:hypothetical protein
MNKLNIINKLLGMMLGLLLWTAWPVQATTCNSFIQQTTPTEDFILDDNSGVATHHESGLIWMRCALGQSWDKVNRSCLGDPSEHTWREALQVANGYHFVGSKGWRLPNINELFSIIEERCAAPGINTTVFPAVSPLSIYWSSSSDANLATHAWSIHLDDGLVHVHDKVNTAYVRLVCGGPFFADFEAEIAANAITLITHYYVSILGRAPEAEGLAYWQERIAASSAQCRDVKPVFRDMAYFFFNSPEYLAKNTSDSQFITNLYLTFFQREPDSGGMSFWLNQLALGISRNDVMSGFLYSEEFTRFMEELGF